MNLLVYLYTLAAISTKGIWVVARFPAFNVDELINLSRKLNPLECLRLLDALHGAAYTSGLDLSKNQPVSLRTLKNAWVTRETCLHRLKDWNERFSRKVTRENLDRMKMEKSLEILGRPDLSKYLRHNSKVVDILSKIGNSKYSSEWQEHVVSRRSTPEPQCVTTVRLKYKKKSDKNDAIVHVIPQLSNSSSKVLAPAFK